MSGSDTKYQVTLTAKDEASDPLSRIGATTEALAKKLGMVAAEGAAAAVTTDELAKKLGAVAAKEGEVAAVAPWLRMRGTIEGVHGAVGKLEGSVGSLYATLGKWVPVMGGIGGGMALSGLFSFAEKNAEKGIKGQEATDRLGITGKEWGKLSYIAKMTETDTDALTKSIQKLNLVAFDAAQGKGPAVSLFKRLGIDPGESTDKLAEDMFKAFGSQVDDAMGTAAKKRAYIARTLMGKGGLDTMSLFGAKEEELDRWSKRFATLAGPKMTEQQKKDRRQYYEDWVSIDTVIGNVNKAVSNELYPALSPVLQQMEQFLVANQATIAMFAGRNTTAFIGMMERIDWKKTGDDARYYGNMIGGVVDKLGGASTIVEILVGYKMLGWARNIVGGFEAIGSAIVALDAVIGGSLFYKIFGAAGLAAYIMRPASTQTDEAERKGLNENTWKGVPWLFPNAKGPDSQKLSDQFRDSDRPPSAEPNSLLNQLRRWYPDGHGGIAMPSPHSPTEALPPVLPSMPGGGISPFAFPTLDGRHPDILPLQLPAPWALGGQPAAAPPNGEVVVRFDFTGLPPGAAAYPELLPGTTGVRVDHDLPNWGLAPDNPLLGPIMPQLGRP